jgi:hypothetical protein
MSRPHQNPLTRLLWIGALVVLPLGAALSAQPSTGGKETFYRCKDRNGQTRYGDSMPPECVGLDTEVLNQRGTTVRVIEGEASRAAREQRETTERKQQQEREEREQRDRMLIDTYQSVADIERLRDERLDLLTSQYKVTETNIANLRERQSRLRAQIARFKPYSESATAPPLPDHLAEEMVNTVNSLRTYQDMLTKNRAEQADIKSSFQAQISRFKELKGLK